MASGPFDVLPYAQRRFPGPFSRGGGLFGLFFLPLAFCFLLPVPRSPLPFPFSPLLFPAFLFPVSSRPDSFRMYFSAVWPCRGRRGAEFRGWQAGGLQDVPQGEQNSSILSGIPAAAGICGIQHVADPRQKHDDPLHPMRADGVIPFPFLLCILFHQICGKKGL